jgi:hypothetical protein
MSKKVTVLFTFLGATTVCVTVVCTGTYLKCKVKLFYKQLTEVTVSLFL